MLLLALQITGGNLLFRFLPESAAVMVFGICLAASTVVARRLFKKHDETAVREEKAEDNSDNRGF